MFQLYGFEQKKFSFTSKMQNNKKEIEFLEKLFLCLYYGFIENLVFLIVSE